MKVTVLLVDYGSLRITPGPQEDDVAARGNHLTDPVPPECQQSIRPQVAVQVGKPRVGHTRNHDPPRGRLDDTADPVELPRSAPKAPEGGLERTVCGVGAHTGQEPVPDNEPPVTLFHEYPHFGDGVTRILLQLDDFQQLEHLCEGG